MPDTTTTAKALTIQTVGGNSGTWGTIENANLTLIDKALGGTLTKALTGDVTLSSTEAQNVCYEFTGALSAVPTVTFPAFRGPIFIRNKTTGGYKVTIGMSTGTTVSIGASLDATAYSDGTDFFIPGMFVQAGSVTLAATTSAHVTFPTPFPNEVISCVGNFADPTALQVGIRVLDATGFDFTVSTSSSGTGYWVAYGR